MPAAEQLWVFVTLTCVVSASPGPVMLACMAYGGRYGLARAGLAMLGSTLGNLLLMLLSALGVGLVLGHSPGFFEAIRWLGAVYLLWLGLQLWRSSGKNAAGNANGLIEPGMELVLKSMGVALSNPKGVIYFAAVFPQFVLPEPPLVAQFGLLTLIFVAIDLVWMLIYAGAGQLIMGWLKEDHHRRWFDRASAAALMLAGVFLLLFSQ